MIEEDIKLIEIDLDLYQILVNIISDNIRTKTVQKAKNSYKKKIKLLNYILEILNKQKK